MGQTRPGQGTPISMSGVIRIWRQAWEEFTPFLRFPPELPVYTTNVVESVHYPTGHQNQGAFPHRCHHRRET